jgi:Icc-related predicted phosphoesterase
MTIVALSDTHGNHARVNIPSGDIVIYSGDCTHKSTFSEIVNFVQWYSSLKIRYKILVAGNHDRFMAKHPYEFSQILRNSDIIYLENNSVQIEKYKFYGSPFSLSFGGTGAFTYPNEEMAKPIWNSIPIDTDFLITHGPPKGFRDFSKTEGRHSGCSVLLAQVLKIKPKYHFFGHIHEAYGIESNGDSVFVNSSLVDGSEDVVNNPVIIQVGS